MAFSTESVLITDPEDLSPPKSLLLMSVASTESQLSFGLLRLGLLGVAAEPDPPPPPGLVEGSIPGKPNLSLFDTGMGAMGSIGAGTSACSSSSSQS